MVFWSYYQCNFDEILGFVFCKSLLEILISYVDDFTNECLVYYLGICSESRRELGSSPLIPLGSPLGEVGLLQLKYYHWVL